MTSRILFAVLLVTALSACSPSLSNHAPCVVDGTLDLRSWDFREQGPVGLHGDWGFYWQRLVPPEELQAHWPDGFAVTNVPDRWRGRDAQGEQIGAHGYATYFMRVLLPPDAPPLAVKVRDAGTAYRMFINGEAVHGAGEVGTDAKHSSPGFERAIVAVPGDPGQELLIVFHVSNFHYRVGGLWEHVVLGSSRDIVRFGERVLGYSIFITSGIGVIGLYHLGLYSLRRRDASTMFFGLACLVAVARQLSTDERYILELLPGMSHNALFRVEYMSMLLGISTFAAYMGSLWPGCYPRWLIPSLVLPGLAFSVFVLVTDPAVFSPWLWLFQIYVLIAAACAFYMIYQAARKRLDMARAFMAGFAILFVAVVNDTLRAMDVLNLPYYLIGTGLFVFIIIQSLSLSRRSAQAYAKVEALTSELEAYSATLEASVQQRTAELAAANAKLEQMAMIDELTQVANRRHFDEALAREWSLHRRRRAPLSLLLIDIDQFKAYNDTYGHLPGDEALRRVAEAIRSVLARPADLVARYGGEEFAVLLPETEAEGMAAMAQKILAAVAALSIPHEASAHGFVSVSIGGVTQTPYDESGGLALVEQADQRLYRAKSEGRNRIVV